MARKPWTRPPKQLLWNQAKSAKARKIPCQTVKVVGKSSGSVWMNWSQCCKTTFLEKHSFTIVWMSEFSPAHAGPQATIASHSQSPRRCSSQASRSSTTESLARNSKTRKIQIERENIIRRRQVLIAYLLEISYRTGKKEEEVFEEGIRSDSPTLSSVYKEVIRNSKRSRVWDVLDFKKRQREQTDLHRNNKLPWLSQTFGMRETLSAEKRLSLKGKERQWFLAKWMQRTWKTMDKGHFSVVLYKKKVKENMIFWHGVKKPR